MSQCRILTYLPYSQSFPIGHCKVSLGEQRVKNQYSKLWDLPCGPVVKNLPANVGDTGLSPGREDFTCFGASKPTHHNCWVSALEPVIHSREAMQWEAHASQLENSPGLLQLDKACSQPQRPSTAKNKKRNITNYIAEEVYRVRLFVISTLIHTCCILINASTQVDQQFPSIQHCDKILPHIELIQKSELLLLFFNFT